MELFNLKKFFFSKGFTLIEFLIVIAVLGVLATIVLAATNPIEQLARGRDAGRKTTVGQLANALEAYYVNQATSAGNSYYPDLTSVSSWIQRLVDAGELKAIPGPISYRISGVTACISSVSPPIGGQNGWCYRGQDVNDDNTVTTDLTQAIVYARLESRNENVKCSGTTPRAFFLWSSNDAKSGVVCIGPAAPALMNGYTYQ